MRREAMRAHSRGVRGDSALCLLQYACLKLSKPGLASRPWHRLPLSMCQCQLQLGAVPATNARLSLARGNACSPLKLGFFSPSYIASFLPLLGCLSLFPLPLSIVLFVSFVFLSFLCFYLVWFISTVLFTFDFLSAHVYAEVFHQILQLLAPSHTHSYTN